MNTTETNTIAPPPQKVSALALMAGRFSVDPAKLFSTLKSTVFKGATDDELLALVVVSNEYGLNPLLKEIYAFPGKGGGIVPVVSIDGWLRMMNDHPQFDGLDYEWQHDGDKLVACTSVIYRKDRSKPVRVTEYLAECRRNTDPWKMEHRMLRHKATIQGARVAFGFSGISDEDEAANIPGLTSARDVTPIPAAVTSPLFAATKSSAIAPPADFNLDSTAPSQREDFLARVQALGVPWADVSRLLLDNGLTDQSYATPDLVEDHEIGQVLAQWRTLENLVKGGKK
jgi:RecT family